ncbi:hypothetical protein PHET_10952 [Paragonimus heterotremus]|uniref:Uncharacterized protein n=1 Tax=Paragonimus heterotremus TaxID=100268 RepID=A0A8J4SU18_9TREM|nr:hypothetical protein PHET_10952 [Paragonimus heterotremus]
MFKPMAPARLSTTLLGVVKKHIPSIKFRSQLKYAPGAQATNASPQQQQPASTFVVKCSIPPEQAVEFTHLNPKFRRKPFTEEEVAIYQCWP